MDSSLLDLTLPDSVADTVGRADTLVPESYIDTAAYGGYGTSEGEVVSSIAKRCQTNADYLALDNRIVPPSGWLTHKKDNAAGALQPRGSEAARPSSVAATSLSSKAAASDVSARPPATGQQGQRQAVRPSAAEHVSSGSSGERAVEKVVAGKDEEKAKAKQSGHGHGSSRASKHIPPEPGDKRVSKYLPAEPSKADQACPQPPAKRERADGAGLVTAATDAGASKQPEVPASSDAPGPPMVKVRKIDEGESAMYIEVKHAYCKLSDLPQHARDIFMSMTSWAGPGESSDTGYTITYKAELLKDRVNA